MKCAIRSKNDHGASTAPTRFSALGLIGVLAIVCFAGNVFFPVETVVGQGTRIAVVDISRIFREHPRLAQLRDEFRRESEALQAHLQSERNNLRKMAEQLKQFKPGTDAYRTKEKELAGTQANLEVQLQLKGKDMREREAKIQYQTYMEIVNLVARFCQRNGLTMVLRYQSKPIDPDDMRSIQAGFNRTVIYQSKLDITDHIIAELQRGIPPTAGGSNRPQIPRRR